MNMNNGHGASGIHLLRTGKAPNGCTSKTAVSALASGYVAGHTNGNAVAASDQLDNESSISANMGIFDLEENFVFYASYHHDTWNKLIHILCVWPILWTGLVFAEYVPYEWTTAPAILSQFHPVNLTFAMVVIYASFYILFDQKAGTLAAFVLFLCLITSRKFFLIAESSYGYPAWGIALVIHVAAWIAQFFGHGHFEGRAPALLDNLVQAFLMAPFFVFLEVLFFFGYRKDFQEKVEKIVLKNIAQFKQQKQKAGSAGGPKKKRK